ncbi:MAG TPA: beta-ketoacyl-ACP synthase III [Burkholderiales bacterium]|nr:ketoacyl-ACP synthase III [Pseudomonadota bacterium]HVC49207.1 beta-ketoacyl-ACP synthase III [Burkholderiales bacterium]
MFSRILGTGAYLPQRELGNKELSLMVDTSDEWIVSRTGIYSRHIAAADEATSDLAFHASRQAIDNSRIDPASIDLVIVATTTPDLVFPSTACILQDKLGIHNHGGAFDIQAVCSGFVYALSVADSFIHSGMHRTILVVGAEVMSRIVDWTDRSNCILFGDGAGAMILQASDEEGIIGCHIHADGRYVAQLCVPAGVSRNPDINAKLSMEGSSVFRMAVNTLDEIVDETLAASGMQKSDINWLVPHQANIRIIQATAKKLGMSMDQVIVTVGSHGNTSAASIPMAFHEGVSQGRIKQGDIVLMEAFGGGFTWGSVLLRR